MKETFKQRKIGKQLVSVMMLGLTISPIVMQTHGVLAQTAHVTTNEATKVTDVALSADLKSAIDAAAPETPKTPQAQEAAAAAAKSSTFAQTGAEVTGGIFAAIAAMAVVGLGWFGFKRKDSK